MNRTSRPQANSFWLRFSSFLKRWLKSFPARPGMTHGRRRYALLTVRGAR